MYNFEGIMTTTNVCTLCKSEISKLDQGLFSFCFVFVCLLLFLFLFLGGRFGVGSGVKGWGLAF